MKSSIASIISERWHLAESLDCHDHKCPRTLLLLVKRRSKNDSKTHAFLKREVKLRWERGKKKVNTSRLSRDHLVSVGFLRGQSNFLLMALRRLALTILLLLVLMSLHRLALLTLLRVTLRPVRLVLRCLVLRNIRLFRDFPPRWQVTFRRYRERPFLVTALRDLLPLVALFLRLPRPRLDAVRLMRLRQRVCVQREFKRSRMVDNLDTTLWGTDSPALLTVDLYEDEGCGERLPLVSQDKPSWMSCM